MTKSGKLEDRHGYKSVYQIVPYNHNETTKDHNFEEYTETLDTSKIMIDQLVDAMVNPLITFFEERSKTELMEARLKEGQIMVRREPGMVLKNVDIASIPSLINQH